MRFENEPDDTRRAAPETERGNRKRKEPDAHLGAITANGNGNTDTSPGPIGTLATSGGYSQREIRASQPYYLRLLRHRNSSSLSELHVRALVRSPDLLCPLLTSLSPSRRLSTALAQRQAERPPRVLRTHLPAYACRIYVKAFRAGIGL